MLSRNSTNRGYLIVGASGLLVGMATNNILLRFSSTSSGNQITSGSPIYSKINELAEKKKMDYQIEKDKDIAWRRGLIADVALQHIPLL